MHLKLSENESVIKIFDYAKSRRQESSVISQNTLVVTNKRIIQQIRSGNAIQRREIPVQDAKYVDTSFYKRYRPIYAVLGVLAAAIGVAGTVYFKNWIPVAIGGGIFAVLMLVYLLATENMVAFTISGDNRITELMSFTGGGRPPRRRRKNGQLFIHVNRKQAMQLVSELGSVILDVRETFGKQTVVTGYTEDVTEDYALLILREVAPRGVTFFVLEYF